jgi:hypothetical protein
MTQGKIERYHRSMKNLILLDNYYSPSELEARIDEWVDYYNNHRYHEAIDNVTPSDRFYGKDKEILEQRQRTKTETKVRYQYSRQGSQEKSMDYLEFIARVTSHIPDKGQVMIRYYGLYSNAHRGKMKKTHEAANPFLIIEQEEPFRPSKGWAEMIRTVYEVDPLLCPSCGGQMKIISFIEDHKVIDRIIAHLKLTFKAERPPPQVAQPELLIAEEEWGEYF